MKRTILSLLIVLLATIPLYADEQPAITYDLAADTFADMLELLDQAIQLAAAAVMTWDSVAIKDYAQGVLNLLEGPESELYDPDSSVDTAESLGLIPMLEALRYPDSRLRGYEDAPLGIFFPELLEVGGGWTRDASVFVQAWKSVAVGLEAASLVAQDIESSSYTRAPWDIETQTLYAHLVAARGSTDSLPIGGLVQLSDLFPSREQWVRQGESIQDAIDSLPEGGIIYIEPGIYREALVIDKPLQLLPFSEADGTYWDLGSVVFADALFGSAITITSEERISVQIQGVELRGNSTAMHVCGQASVELADVMFADNGVALRLEDAGDVIARECEFSDGSTAVRLYAGTSATLYQCVIRRMSDWYGAVVVDPLTAAWIEDCDITDNQGAGVHVLTCSSFHMTDSRLLRNGNGLHLTPGGCPDEDGYITRFPIQYAEVTGWNNVIPGPGDPDGNGGAAINDSVYGGEGIDLSFLTEPKPEDE